MTEKDILRTHYPYLFRISNASDYRIHRGSKTLTIACWPPPPTTPFKLCNFVWQFYGFSKYVYNFKTITKFICTSLYLNTVKAFQPTPPGPRSLLYQNCKQITFCNFTRSFLINLLIIHRMLVSVKWINTFSLDIQCKQSHTPIVQNSLLSAEIKKECVFNLLPFFSFSLFKTKD